MASPAATSPAATSPSPMQDGGEKVELSDADKALLRMGYVPTFKRDFSPWACFAFAMSISGLYGTIMSTFVYPLTAGGASSVVWCWIISGAGSFALAVSIAEISSAYPTSGGMYFSLKYLGPERYVGVLCWIDGWLHLAGALAGNAGAAYAEGQMLLSVVSIGTDLDYVPAQTHVVAVSLGLTVAHAVINSLPTAWLSRLSVSYAAFHLGVLVAACLVLLVMQHDKRSTEYIFTDFEPVSGWTPPGWAFLFGSLSAAWTMTNCDGLTHISEETVNPEKVVPNALTMAAAFTWIIGFVFNTILVACMGEDGPRRLLDSPTGHPITQLFYDVAGRPAAIFFSLASFIVMNFGSIPSMQAGSRTVWAFARDGMLPGSAVWLRTWTRTHTPVAAVWLYAVVQMAINLVALGSAVAAASVFNVCVVAFNISYIIPLLCKLLFGRFRPGPWYLGHRASIVVNVLALLWNGFLTILCLLPTKLPATAENMNYASAILVFLLILASTVWIFKGRFYYEGPQTSPAADVLMVENNIDPNEVTLNDRTDKRTEP